MKGKREIWVVRCPYPNMSDDVVNEHREDLERFSIEEEIRVERLLLDNGIISVNHWSVGDLSATRSEEDIFQCVRTVSKIDPLNRKLITPSFWLFIHEIQLDDIAVLPLQNGKYAIGIVKGEYEYKKISSEVTHTRRVRWLRTDAVIDANVLRCSTGNWPASLCIGKLAGELQHELLEEIEKSDDYMREKYLGLACKECDDPKHQICPSCDMRYEKLARIDKLIDGAGNWDDFADTAEKRRLRKK